MCGFGWAGMWVGSGKCWGGETLIQIYFIKNYISIKKYFLFQWGKKKGKKLRNMSRRQIIGKTRKRVI